MATGNRRQRQNLEDRGKTKPEHALAVIKAGLVQTLTMRLETDLRTRSLRSLASSVQFSLSVRVKGRAQSGW